MNTFPCHHIQYDNELGNIYSWPRSSFDNDYSLGLRQCLSLVLEIPTDEEVTYHIKALIVRQL